MTESAYASVESVHGVCESSERSGRREGRGRDASRKVQKSKLKRGFLRAATIAEGVYWRIRRRRSTEENTNEKKIEVPARFVPPRSSSLPLAVSVPFLLCSSHSTHRTPPRPTRVAPDLLPSSLSSLISPPFPLAINTPDRCTNSSSEPSTLC